MPTGWVRRDPRAWHAGTPVRVGAWSTRPMAGARAHLQTREHGYRPSRATRSAPHRTARWLGPAVLAAWWSACSSQSPSRRRRRRPAPARAVAVAAADPPPTPAPKPPPAPEPTRRRRPPRRHRSRPRRARPPRRPRPRCRHPPRPPTPAADPPPPVVPTTITTLGSTVRFYGRGYGHGVGLSQYGARGRALAGQTAEQILTAYFKGSTLSAISPTRTVRVLLMSGFPAHVHRTARRSTAGAARGAIAGVDKVFPADAVLKAWRDHDDSRRCLHHHLAGPRDGGRRQDRSCTRRP